MIYSAPKQVAFFRAGHTKMFKHLVSGFLGRSAQRGRNDKASTWTVARFDGDLQRLGWKREVGRQTDRESVTVKLVQRTVGAEEKENLQTSVQGEYRAS